MDCTWIIWLRCVLLRQNLVISTAWEQLVFDGVENILGGKKMVVLIGANIFVKIFFIADTLILDWRTQTRGVRETWKIWKPWINHICACAWKLPIGWPSYNIALISRINFNFYVLEVFINYRKAWHQVCQSCAIIAS